MQLVTVNNGVAVTTTLAIAEGTGSDHASVIKLVRNYQNDLEEFGLLDFKSESTGGRPTEFAVLNEQQSTLILTYMRNNEVVRTFKKRLVKAFYELANRAKDPMAALNDPAAMRGLLLTYTEKVLEQQAVIDELKPQAAIANRICLADGSLCLTDAAKTLGLQPKKVLIPWMKANRWIYQRTGSDHAVAYQDKLQQMLLEHKVTTVTRGDGSERISEQVLVTPKGLARLADIFNVEAETGFFNKGT